MEFQQEAFSQHSVIQPINPNQGEIVFPLIISKLLDSKEA